MSIGCCSSTVLVEKHAHYNCFSHSVHRQSLRRSVVATQRHTVAATVSAASTVSPTCCLVARRWLTYARTPLLPTSKGVGRECVSKGASERWSARSAEQSAPRGGPALAFLGKLCACFFVSRRGGPHCRVCCRKLQSDNCACFEGGTRSKVLQSRTPTGRPCWQLCTASLVAQCYYRKSSNEVGPWTISSRGDKILRLPLLYDRHGQRQCCFALLLAEL